LPFTDLDKIYWFRVGLGSAGGVLAELVTGCKATIPPVANASACVGGANPDYSTGILLGLFLFLASYYFLRATIAKGFPKDEQRKVYTTGAGSFALLFVFFWVLLFTLGIHFLNL
jgi:hypothetical protein